MSTNRKKALFIGLTTIDIQYFVEYFPLPNTKHKTDAPLIAAGGPAANAAIAYAVLGGEVDFLTCIGQNSFTQVILDDFANFGVRVIDHLHGTSFDPIVSAVITTLSNSERTIITHHPVGLESAFGNDQLTITNYDLIFIDGFYPELSLNLLQKARENKIPVVFDGGSWKAHLPKLLNYVDVAICSGNFHPPGCSTDLEIVSYLKTAGVVDVAISKGEKDIVCEQEMIEVEKVEPVDSLGAGDVLHGAFCWYWLNDKQFIPALKSASKVATLSVKYRGTHQWITGLSDLK